MHAFIAAVLLRMARLDALDANDQPEPPDRDLAQVNGKVIRTSCTSEQAREAAVLNTRRRFSTTVAKDANTP